MSDPYFAYVASAYGLSALFLAGLGLWTFLDARASRRALDRLEGGRARRRRPDAAS